MSRLFATLLLLLFALLLSVSGTSERILIVDAGALAGEDSDNDAVFRTITAALAAARAGDALQVRPGRYDPALGERFPLVLDKPLRLEAIGDRESTIIDAGGAGSALEVRAPNITIKNLTVQNVQGDRGAGIAVFDVNGPVEITGNIVQAIAAAADSYAFGIRVYNSSGTITIHDNIIRNITGNGISVGHSQGVQVLDNQITAIEPALIDELFYAVGIAVNASSAVLVERNTVSRSTIGISLMGSQDCHVSQNVLGENHQEQSIEYAGARFTQPGCGILVAFGSTGNEISDNTVNGNGVGIGLYMADDNIVGNNIIIANRVSTLDIPEAEGPLHGVGLALDYSNRNRVSSNTIQDNGDAGVALKDSSLNTIKENEITGQRIGLLLHGGVRDATNTISGNKIAHNTAIGIEIRGGYSAIEYNTIIANGLGILLTAEATARDHRAVNNDIYDNEFGVRNDGQGALDATNNWWGAPSGPYHPQLNPRGQGDPVSDGVRFAPWSETNINK